MSDAPTNAGPRALTRRNPYSHVLGVKGSQVQILSSRRRDGEYSQVRALIHASESGP
jgi:hypothetical protein